MAAEVRYHAALKLYADGISKASDAYAQALKTAALMADPVRAAELKENVREVWERTTELLSASLHTALNEYVHSIRGEESDH
jgi:hypothetical protein